MESNWMDEKPVGILDDALTALSRLADALSETMLEQNRVETELKTIKERRLTLERESIPDLLHQHGLSDIRLKDGRQIIVKTDLTARMPVDPVNRQVVLNWIENNGGAGIIHDVLVLEEPSENLIEGLLERGEDFSRKEEVNAATLKAYFREILGMKKGFSAVCSSSDVPQAAGLFIYNTTRIK